MPFPDFRIREKFRNFASDNRGKRRTTTFFRQNNIPMRQLLFFICLFCSCTMQAQERKHSTFYYQRVTLFETLPTSPDDIIFLGNSITNGCEWAELLGNVHAKNRGISGDTTNGVLDRLGTVTAGKPAKVFLLIGTNDLSAGLTIDSIATNVERIVQRIGHESPTTRIYLQSVLPVTPHYGMFQGHTRRKDDIAPLNTLLKAVAARNGIAFIDIHAALTDPATNELNTDYTNDGLHLLGKAYRKWAEILRPYVAE